MKRLTQKGFRNPDSVSPFLSLWTEHDVLVVNENIEKMPFKYPADLVGISITLDVFPRACEIAYK